MKPIPLLLAGLLAAACSPGDVLVSGTLADGWPDEALFVSVEGEPDEVAVENGGFEIARAPAGPLRFRIRSAEETLARIEIDELPSGAVIEMARLRRHRRSELAFPAAIRLEGADVVTVNGIRMADPALLPAELELGAVVLALNAREGMLLLRPDGGDLPDLPTLLSEETTIVDVEDEETSLSRLDPGDSVRVRGRTSSGYLWAERIVVPRDPGRDRPQPAGAGTTAPAPARPARGSVSEREAGESRVAPGREDRGRGRGQGRGRGRGGGPSKPRTSADEARPGGAAGAHGTHALFAHR